MWAPWISDLNARNDSRPKLRRNRSVAAGGITIGPVGMRTQMTVESALGPGSVGSRMRRLRPLADVGNREFDDTVVKDVVVSVGELDQHPVVAR